MKTKNFILLISFFLMGSHVISSQSKTGNLPVINVLKSYPKMEMILQDVANVEYVPLETTDDILLGDMASLSYVSDKFILVHEPIRGDIFVFNRSGKIYSHFNHKGQSGKEYAWIEYAGTIFDEKNEEIYVCSRVIQVYSLRGEYKRTLKINTIQNGMKIFNYDDSSLLVYEGVSVDDFAKYNANKSPYRLISKKDGSVISVIDIYLPKRYSTTILKSEGKSWTTVHKSFPSNMHFGQNFVIADISSDTLYLLTQNKELTPLLTRKPSVHASEPRNVWTTFFTTDKFILFGMIPLDINAKGGRIPILMYEFESGKTSELSILDADNGMKKCGIGSSTATMRNTTAEMIQVSSLMLPYKGNRLRGNLEKILKTLDEEDNPVVRIIKFK